MKLILLPSWWGFPGGSASKESACNTRDIGSILGSGRYPGGGHGNPFQFPSWRIPWTEEPGRLQCMGLQKSQIGLRRLRTQGCIILIQNRQCWMLKCSFNLPCDFHGYYFQTVVLEKTLESPLDCKEIQPGNPKVNQSLNIHWRINAEAETPVLLATWCKVLTHLKRPWCWERLKAGEGDNRGWDGWMASLTQQTWV